MIRMSLICLALLNLLTACAPYMYGVPQETWDRMSESQRTEAMRIYDREQQARRQAAEERARRQAVEEQARRKAAEEQARYEAQERQRAQARQTALERERRERVDAIHRGNGAYGELIRVRMQGGKIRIGDRMHRYEPVTFTIADGETRTISASGFQGRAVELVVTYGGGALDLEGVRFTYDRSWGRGRLYANMNTTGTLDLHAVDIYVEVHDRSSRLDREQPRLVIVREPDPPVIRERVPQQAPPVVIRGHDAPKQPPVIVRDRDFPKPPPAADRAPRAIEITLLSGETNVRGQTQQIERAVFRMNEGENRDLQIKAGKENRTVSFHYRNGELVIDGTPGGRANDAVRLAYDREWKGGKLYRIDLKGREQTDRLELRITGVKQ